MEKKNELMVFEQSGLGKLSIIKINDEDTFNLSDICFGLGYTRNNSIGKPYLRKDDIESKCKTLDIVGVSLTGTNLEITKDIDFENTYISEESFYDLALESKAKNARTFRKWVTSEILPSLRKRGVYIMEHAKEEVIDKEKLFGKRRIKNTFANAEIHEVEKLYDDFLEYVSEEYNAKDKINMLQSVYNGLGELNLKLSHDAVKNVGKCYDISLLQNIVLKDKAYYQNKRNGGIKSSKTKTINKLNPPIEDYMIFDVHPFSENNMYEATTSDDTGKPILVRTEIYKKWLEQFPKYQAIDKTELNIRWDKPIKMFIKVDCLDKFDSSNFIKATNDMIINRIYLEDDSIVKDTIISTNKIINNYDDGKVYVYIQNI